MKRRNFFLLSLAGVATVAIPSYYIWNNRNLRKNLLYEPRILTSILETSDIVTIGRIYSEQFPKIKLKKKLQNFLIENKDRENRDLEIILEATVKKDFQTGNTVVLDGWILSETEAIQCALFSTSELNQS
ncbi:hypothetical protein [Sediminicola arcticus]|jgi:hypothetical protein|uniref:Uncharacterized protein n=1 Tax=Sediminicola arcticus TaxID=1574308 RepID=A0ABV2SQR3_9FLAO